MHEQLSRSRQGSPFREPAVILGNVDIARLRAVVERYINGPDRAAAEQLEAELDRAIVVPQAEVPREIATMNSRVVFVDRGTGRSRVITLAHPAEADPASGRISILAPVATALLGLGVGDSIDWPMPDGKTARLEITSVLYQPDAPADLHR